MRVTMIIGLMFLGAIIAEKALADGYMGGSGVYVDSRTNHTGVLVFGGYEVNNFVGFEGMTIVNSSNEGLRGESVEVDNFYGFALVAGFDITDNIRPIISYGHHWIEIGDLDDSATSLTAGVEYHLLEQWDIRATYGGYGDVNAFRLDLKMNF